MSVLSRFGSSSFCLALSLAVGPTALAEDTVPAERRVIVTATRTPTPIEEVLASVVVIDRDESVYSLAAHAADLRRFHAGLDIARTGGPGQTLSLFIRRAESNHMLLMVDCVRINPVMIGHS